MVQLLLTHPRGIQLVTQVKQNKRNRRPRPTTPFLYCYLLLQLHGCCRRYLQPLGKPRSRHQWLPSLTLRSLHFDEGELSWARKRRCEWAVTANLCFKKYFDLVNENYKHIDEVCIEFTSFSRHPGRLYILAYTFSYIIYDSGWKLVTFFL